MARLKHTSVARILDLLQCKAKYYAKVTRPRELRDEPTRRGVTGQATHMLAAGATPSDARMFIDTRLADRSESMRHRIFSEAMILARRAKLSRHAQSTGERLEHRFVYRGFKGWEVFAEPDEAHFYNRLLDQPVVVGRHGRVSNRERVLRVGDCKVTDEVMEWHWTQVEMFTFIVTEINQWRGPTEMLIYPLKQGWVNVHRNPEGRRLEVCGPTGPVVPARRWWTPELAEQTEYRMLSALIEMERSWEKNDFARKAGGHCFGCIERHTCPLGKAFMEQRLAQYAAAAAAAAGVTEPTTDRSAQTLDTPPAIPSADGDQAQTTPAA